MTSDNLEGLPMTSYQFVKFGSHRHCGSGHKMILSCHVISTDQVIEGPFNFMEPIKVCYGPAKFGGHRHCGSENIMILVCHVIL